MRTLNKTISMLLAIVLVLGAFAVVPASAAADSDSAASYTSDLATPRAGLQEIAAKPLSSMHQA